MKFTRKEKIIMAVIAISLIPILWLAFVIVMVISIGTQYMVLAQLK